LRYWNSAFIPRIYICVSYGSHNKQRLFPWTTLTDWSLRKHVFSVRYGLNICVLEEIQTWISAFLLCLCCPV
jgi:hypothetical protein